MKELSRPDTEREANRRLQAEVQVLNQVGRSMITLIQSRTRNETAIGIAYDLAEEYKNTFLLGEKEFNLKSHAEDPIRSARVILTLKAERMKTISWFKEVPLKEWLLNPIQRLRDRAGWMEFIRVTRRLT